MPEEIGGVSVSITGDLSDLQASFEQAQSLAEKSGAEVASAFDGAAAGADTLTQGIAALGGSMTDTSGAFDTATTGAQGAGGAFTDTGDSAYYASQNTDTLKDSVVVVGEEAEKTGSSFKEMLTTLLEFAGIGVSIEALREFAIGCMESFSAVERATIAIGALRANVDEAGARIEALRATAQEFAVPFEDLVRVEQRFAAFGLSVRESIDAMHAAIEAAAAMNEGVGEAANSIDRLAISGMAGARQLVALGLHSEDLARVMGVTNDSVREAFKSADWETRLEIIEQSLRKFSGTAEQVANTAGGSWQRLKNDITHAMEAIGEFTAQAIYGMRPVETTAEYIGRLETAAHAAGLQFANLTRQYIQGGMDAYVYAANLKELIKGHDDAANAATAARLKEKIAGEAGAADTEENSAKIEAAALKEGEAWQTALQKFNAFTDSLKNRKVEDIIPQISVQDLMKLPTEPGDLRGLPQIDRLAELWNVAQAAAAGYDSEQGLLARNAAITAQVMGGEVENMGHAWQTLTKDVDKAFGDVERGFASAIVHAHTAGQVFHQLWTSFAEDIIKDVLSAIDQAIARLAVMQAITAALGPLLGFGGGGGVTFLGGSTSSGMHFAEGGFVPMTGLATVHEGEYISPSHQVAAGNYGPAGASMGAPQLHMTIHMHGATSDLCDDVANTMIKAGRRAGVNW